MAINQSQNGVDDEIEVPQELYANERFRLGKKGTILLHVYTVYIYQFADELIK